MSSWLEALSSFFGEQLKNLMVVEVGSSADVQKISDADGDVLLISYKPSTEAFDAAKKSHWKYVVLRDDDGSLQSPWHDVYRLDQGITIFKQKDPVTTVVIPSVGRKTITRALISLIRQDCPLWRAQVGFDAIDDQVKKELVLIKDPRISYILLEEKKGGGQNHGGRVRNLLIERSSTEWVCFLDDDDTFRESYVSNLILEASLTGANVVMFRMSYDPQDRMVLPPEGMVKPVICRVGISFAVRKSFLQKNNLAFENDGAEDFKLLKQIDDLGEKIFFSKQITYNIRYFKP